MDKKGLLIRHGIFMEGKNRKKTNGQNKPIAKTFEDSDVSVVQGKYKACLLLSYNTVDLGSYYWHYSEAKKM